MTTFRDFGGVLRQLAVTPTVARRLAVLADDGVVMTSDGAGTHDPMDYAGMSLYEALVAVEGAVLAPHEDRPDVQLALLGIALRAMSDDRARLQARVVRLGRELAAAHVHEQHAWRQGVLHGALGDGPPSHSHWHSHNTLSTGQWGTCDWCGVEDRLYDIGAFRQCRECKIESEE